MSARELAIGIEIKVEDGPYTETIQRLDMIYGFLHIKNILNFSLIYISIGKQLKIV